LVKLVKIIIVFYFNLGFNDWYLSQLPDKLREKAKTLIESQKNLINNLDCDDKTKQYYIAIGFNVPCRVSYGLPATVYTVELRSGKAVHPTLRKVAHLMHKSIAEQFPNLKLYSDLQESEWDIARGSQSITKK